MQLLLAKRQELYPYELSSQNGEHLVNQTSLERKSPQCPLYSELTKTTFLLKSTNNTKININHHRLIGDE